MGMWMVCGSEGSWQEDVRDGIPEVDMGIAGVDCGMRKGLPGDLTKERSPQTDNYAVFDEVIWIGDEEWDHGLYEVTFALVMRSSFKSFGATRNDVGGCKPLRLV